MTDQAMNPMSLTMPDRAFSGVLRCLDLRSLASCRLVCRNWRFRVDASAALGAARVSKLYGTPTAWQAMRLSTRSCIICSLLPEEVVTSEEELLPIRQDLQLLPRSDTSGQGGEQLTTQMLDQRRCRLLRRQIRVPQVPDDFMITAKYCATSWVGLLHCRCDEGDVIVALPLEPGRGGLGGDEVLAHAVIGLPEAKVINANMATHECATCGETQLLFLTKLGHLKLWSLPPAANSFGRAPAVITKPHAVLTDRLVGSSEEGLIIMKVAAPADADFAVFAIINSNDGDTRTTVTFVRSQCRSLSLIRSRISLGGDECGFVTDTTGVLVTMVIDNRRRRPEQAQCQRRLRVTRFVLTGPNCSVHQEVCLYNSPVPSSEIVRARPRLLGFGAKLLCVSLRNDQSIALYQPKCPQPLVVISLPCSVPGLFFPVSDWLDRGIDPERESSPLLVSFGFDAASRLLSWSFAKEAPPTAEWRQPVQFGGSVAE